MTSRERVLRAIEFRNPDRVPFLSPIPALTDIFYIGVYPAAYWQPDNGYLPQLNRWLYFIGNWRWKKGSASDLAKSDLPRMDEFGCVWTAPIPDSIGEVTGHPMKEIADVNAVHIPDPHRGERFSAFERFADMLAKDKFILGDLTNGPWERAHFLRGYAELMEDLALRPAPVERLLDRLADEWYMGLIEEHGRRGCDGVIMTDDWGTQDRLMVSPAMWRRIFKPRYARLIAAAHEQGMKFFFHSCGDIRAIIGDLIEIGLDVLQKDDLECLGTAWLEQTFAGKLCFLSPLDLQRTLPGASDWTIGREVKKTIRRLGSCGGGIMGMTYMQPEAIGLNWRQFAVMHYYFRRYGKMKDAAAPA
jgi:uroporphyrinogen decarboxylase